MKQVNLRDFYPDYYDEDFFTEVPDDVFETLLEFERAEHADDVKRWRYKAHYSLDANMRYISRQLTVPSAEEEYESRTEAELLCSKVQSALDLLSESQARHIRYRFYDEKTYQEVAEIEGTYRANIRRSNQRAIKELKKIFQSSGKVDYK